MTPVAGAGLKAQWEADGWCVLERFLPDEAVAAATEQLESLFPSAEDFAADRDHTLVVPRTDPGYQQLELFVS